MRCVKGMLGTTVAAMGMAFALAMGLGAGESEKKKIVLPELPPVWELNPGLYDNEGCLVVPEKDGGRKCGAKRRAAPARREDESPAAHRALKGFIGPHFAPQVKGTAVEVLEGSLNVAATGAWQAMGLVRNETLEDVGAVVVTVSLFSKDGEHLENSSAEVSVSPLRPGEPAPFRISASVDAAQVGRIEWSVKAGSPKRRVSREFLIQPYRQMPYGEAIFRGVERADPPYPYVLAAGFRNLGARVREANLVVAWLDSAGRVVWMETAALDPQTLRDIPRGGAANFSNLEVFHPRIGPLLAELTQIVWVVGE